MSDLGNKEVMAKNISYYMNLHGKTRADVSRELHIKYTTLTDWIKGNTYPRIDKIELMARYFGIEKSDLVESKDSAVKKITVTSSESDLLDAFSVLNNTGQLEAIKRVRELSHIQEYVEKESDQRYA